MLTIQWRRAGKDVAHIQVRGPLIGEAASERLRRTLAAAAEEHSRLLVDLSAVTQIDAVSIAEIARVAATVRWAGGDVCVVAGNEVNERIAAAGFEQAFKLTADADQALRCLTQDSC